MLRRHFATMGAGAAVQIAINSNVANVNLRTLAGSPSGAVSVVCTIASGVVVYSTSAASPAFDTGSGWTAGSMLTLINKGTICGRLGAKGNGGAGAGGDGGDGGDAAKLNFDLTIDNTYGTIEGGGGGGGGGGAGPHGDGGDGGAGAGCTASGGINAKTQWTQGGAGAGDGGPAGDFGQNGTKGSNGLSYPGGAKGLGGKAIALNTHSVTWLGGNNPTQCKGAVS